MTDDKAAPPLVSVVLPTYNRPDYLRATLASVLAQTCRDIEILVEDNASAVDPAPILAAFHDPRIVHHRRDQTVPQVENVITACRRARGKYLAIIGDDDLWDPRFLETLMAPLEADDRLAVAFSDHGIIDAMGRHDQAAADRASRIYGRDRLAPGRHLPFHDIAVVQRAICGFSAALYRRRDIDWSAVPLDLGFGPIDHYVTCLAARTGKGCFYVPERLAQYRYHPAALGAAHAPPDRRIAAARFAMVFWRRLARDEAFKSLRGYCEMRLAVNALVIVASLLRAHKAKSAMREAWRAWRDGLFRPSTLPRYAAAALRLRRIVA